MVVIIHPPLAVALAGDHAGSQQPRSSRCLKGHNWLPHEHVVFRRGCSAVTVRQGVEIARIEGGIPRCCRESEASSGCESAERRDFPSGGTEKRRPLRQQGDVNRRGLTPLHQTRVAGSDVEPGGRAFVNSGAHNDTRRGVTIVVHDASDRHHRQKRERHRGIRSGSYPKWTARRVRARHRRVDVARRHRRPIDFAKRVRRAVVNRDAVEPRENKVAVHDIHGRVRLQAGPSKLRAPPAWRSLRGAVTVHSNLLAALSLRIRPLKS